MPDEVQYAVRRTDGVPMAGEYTFLGVGDAADWAPAEEDAEWSDDPIEYEMVRLVITRVGVRSFPVFDEEEQP